MTEIDTNVENGDSQETPIEGEKSLLGCGVEYRNGFYINTNNNKVIKIHHPSWTIVTTFFEVLLLLIIIDTILTWTVFVMVETFWIYQFLIVLISLFLSIKALNVVSGEIEIGWQALSLVFKKRKNKRYSEGFFLISSRYRGFHTVDMRSLLDDIGAFEVSVRDSTKLGGITDESEEKESGTQGSESEEKESGTQGSESEEKEFIARIEIRFDPSIDFRILDPFGFLNVKDLLGKLKSSTESAIRVFVEGMTDEEIFNAKEELEKALANKLSEDALTWYIEIIRISLTDIDYAREDVRNAQSDLRLAEIKNNKMLKRADAIRKGIGRISREFPGISELDALTTVRAELGLQTLTEKRVTGNADSLLKSASVLADSLGGNK